MSKNKVAAIIVACTIAVIAAIVILKFEPWNGTLPAETYTLTTVASPSGAGYVSPSGGAYEPGEQTTLTASPASGYTFDRWGGDISGTWSTIVVSMDSDKDITAYFEEEPPATSEPITFTGSSGRTTPPFTITTSEWIIDWSYIPADPEYPEWAGFYFFIYPRGETVDYVEALFSPGSTSGSTYSYAGPGEYYVEVLAANLESWTIIISPA